MSQPVAPANPPPAESGAVKTTVPVKPQESTRDTIESILFAFVLAFLYRTFEQEAFVIPTGSMAPTLYGRHKEADCEGCGFHLVVGASQEFNPDAGLVGKEERISVAVCPNCGFANTKIRDALAFNGDRILVNKFPYEFSEPHRWDVFVFKFPEQPKTNYIKRLVGLPGETVRIRGGNLFRVHDDAEEMLRKAPDKQRVLQIPVYDDAEHPEKLIAAGWPERWAGMSLSGAGDDPVWSETAAGWQADRQNRTYTLNAAAGQAPQWLRYRHYLPTPRDWETLRKGSPLQPQMRLIGDFCGYNATMTTLRDEPDTGPFWVGDLTINLSARIKSATDQSQLLLELCEGSTWYRCVINPSTGAATLQAVNTLVGLEPRQLAEGKTSVRGSGTYDLAFANVDNRLTLWVNGRVVDFGEGATLPEEGATGNPFPTRNDLTPVGVAATGMDVELSALKLERDMYYRVAYPPNRVGDIWTLARNVYDPDKWAQAYASFAVEYGQRDLEIPADHFLAFGDNSPESNDSRMWTAKPPAVPREYLVGKAFFIYWPHGIPFMNNGRGYTVTAHRVADSINPHRNLVNAPEIDKEYPRYTFPFYPQFWRMHRIR